MVCSSACSLIFSTASHNCLGLVVGAAIFGSMTMAAMLGTVIPLVLKRFDFDAAIATGPFVTTSIDIVGVMMYFYIAKFILGL